jgi:hypothetical protein
VHREILGFYLEQTKLIGIVWQLERPVAKRHQCLGQPVEDRSVDMLRGRLDKLGYTLCPPYILVTVCTDIVTVRIPLTYSNCTVATVHIGNSVR